MVRRARISVCLPLLAVLCACRGGETTPTPAGASIVLVTIDTLRADRLPAYGYPAGATPAIDRLAADGTLFEHAFSPVPLTLPAHSTILTGLLPPTHGVRDNLGYRLEAGRSIVPRLEAAGYRTAAAVSSVVLRRETGLAAGFDLYDDDVATGAGLTAAEEQRSGPETLDAVESWLPADAGTPFFLFLHLYEPHAPYTPPAAFAGGDPYDGEISAADAVVGRLLRLLDERGLYDGTAIVLLSDHGEGLGDHGEQEHGILLHHEDLHVPLILKLPGEPGRGGRVDVPVHLMDVAPTLLELAGLPVSEGLPGSSLLHPPPAGRSLYAETYHPSLRYGWSELLSVVEWPYHLIEGPRPELYDLAEDPGETRDLTAADGEVRTRLLASLRPLRADPAPPFTETEEVRQRLASLGYLDVTRGVGGDRRLNPKDQLPTLHRFRTALDALRAGRPADAVRTLQALVEESPRSLEAWQFLGEAYRRQGKWSEAYGAFSEALNLSRGAPELLEAVAQCAVRLGRGDEAIDLLRLAVNASPDSLPYRFGLVQALLGADRIDEAATVAEGSVERSARRDPDALFQLAVVRIRQGDGDAARELLRRTVEIAPDHEAALYQLALVYAAEGDHEDAETLLERLLVLDPADHNARQTLEAMRRRQSTG
ncbi:MAG: sulfatase-like hydrolase/transferase [Thermoanaerobaculia bacterium]